MKMLGTDVAVIGAGTAGLAAYHAAKAAGASAVLIESGEYGSTCARVGCMPSKLLIAAGQAAHAARMAPAFGTHVEGVVRVDGREVMDRVRRERDRFVGFVLRETENVPPVERIRGSARLIDDHTVEIAGRGSVTCKSIVIATGSRPVHPDSFSELGDRVVTSDELFDWHDLPRSVAVIGTGVIGLELGQALHRLGVRVAVLGRGGGVATLSDPQILRYAIATFNQEFTLEPDARIAAMQRDGDRVVVRHVGASGLKKSEQFDYVLAATGRAPNVIGLGLDKTTLELDAKGLPSFDRATMRTTSADGASSILIAGDACGFIPLLHEAADDGRIAGENAACIALGKPVNRVQRRAPINIVFSDPQIAVVGGGFRALDPGRFATGRASFEDQGRSRILLQNKGLLHVYGELATGLFLGAEMLAPAAEHLAHLLAWALQSKMTVAQMLEMPFYHPVIEEGVRTALRDLEVRLGAARTSERKVA